MGSRVFGNRPDCAYYLLLGLCVAVMFTAFGGIFTYIGYWPQAVFHHHHHHYHHYNNSDLTHPPSSSSSFTKNYYEYGANEKSIHVYSIIGPVFLVIGLGIALLVGVLAIKYDCEYEPEEPKTAILRLASEMSLNLSHNGSDSKYELMTNMTPTGTSSSSGRGTTNTNHNFSSLHHHHPTDNFPRRADATSSSSSFPPPVV